ncbi:MAG: allene oxide cyclase barrel-like domain-containing protein [Solirubrobacteraceae bacterium]
MRKIILATVAAVLTFGGVALANDRATKSSHDAHHGQIGVIKLFSSTVQFKQLDLGDNGFSIGDEILFADDLLSAKGRANVGADGGVCTVVRVDDATSATGTLQCPVTLSLHDGQLFTVGLVHLANGALSGTQTVAVSGGTGQLRGAHGEVAIKFLTPTEANYTITLTK